MLQKKFVLFFKKEAVLCISAICAFISMFFVPPSISYLSYIDFRVICLLFCLMVVVSGLQKCSFFAFLAQKLLSGKKQLRVLSFLLLLLPFFSSMFITNDVALITFVPFTILILKTIGHIDYMAYLIVFQTIAANLGSMATPVGNPQNLFLYSKFSIPAFQFFAVLLPFTILSLFLLFIASGKVKREVIKVNFTKNETINLKPFLLFSFLFILCLLSVFHILHFFILLVIIAVCLFLFDRELYKKADYALLLTFIFFFIFAGNIGNISEVKLFLAGIMKKNTLLTAVIASQVISNVPAAVLLSNFTDNWQELLLGTNIGGLGTPIASLASLISLKFYLNSGEAKASRYIAVFTAANFLILIIFLLLIFLF